MMVLIHRCSCIVDYPTNWNAHFDWLINFGERKEINNCFFLCILGSPNGTFKKLAWMIVNLSLVIVQFHLSVVDHYDLDIVYKDIVIKIQMRCQVRSWIYRLLDAFLIIVRFIDSKFLVFLWVFRNVLNWAQSKTKFTVNECDFESAMIIDENSEIGEMIKFGFCKYYELVELSTK